MMNSPPIRLLRATPWASAAALYAWCTAAALTVRIEPATLMIVVPPALVASAPLLLWEWRRPRTAALAALALTVWAVVGIAQLGLFFLPSALLLAVAYFRSSNTLRRPE